MGDGDDPEQNFLLRDLVLGKSSRINQQRLEVASEGRGLADADALHLVTLDLRPQVFLFDQS